MTNPQKLNRDVTFPYAWIEPDSKRSGPLLRYPFPQDFLWGTATSAYQIEGAWDADGRSESIWDRFAHTPGKILTGETGDVACDHYHRWREDVELMRVLGLSAYRFSISWPRVIPTGTGDVNPNGLGFYDRLVDGLLQAGITPFITLYHWDLPQALEDTGGWLNRDTAKAFAEYASVVFARLGDRAKHWITINEPFSIAFGGYALGFSAPGLKDYHSAIKVAHHLNLAHGLAIGAVRDIIPDAKIGASLSGSLNKPADDSEEASRAAELYNQAYTFWYTDPILEGKYPQPVTEILERKGWMPEIQDGDMECISQRTDFLGLNYYIHRYITADGDDPITGTGLLNDPTLPSHLDWVIAPEGLYETVESINCKYGPMPIYITENGLPGGGPANWSPFPEDGPVPSYFTPDGLTVCDENVDERQFVRDDVRILCMREHLIQLHKAIEAGFDVRGYFHWSLMDNFEWAMGNSMRFGIVRTVPGTLDRVVKKSGLWYSRTATRNGFV
jgi:beta-glucosidase